tara:strand:+ start:412 stop:1431 length:1020 start_codon:yes stop_codon:yes gene_type:complete
MASIWGGDSPSVAWGENSWQSNTVTISLTAPSASTSSVGSITAFNQNGWGGAQWGNDGWGVNYSVALTGLQATSALGTPLAEEFLDVPLTAPSASTASLGSLTLDLTSFAALTAPSQMTSAVGSFDNAGTLVGWGRNGWGEEPYGDSFNKLVQPTGISATASVGAIAPADVMGLTGVEATSSVGSINLQFTYTLDGQSATASVGSIVPEIGVPLTGVSSTASVGSIVPEIGVPLTGVEATTSIGEITVTEVLIVRIGLDGVDTPATLTSSVGAIIPEIGVPLTGISATASVGAIAPEDVMGLTGLEATSEIGTTGFGTIAYKDIDITGNTSYTDVNHAA